MIIIFKHGNYIITCERIFQYGWLKVGLELDQAGLGHIPTRARPEKKFWTSGRA